MAREGLRTWPVSGVDLDLLAQGAADALHGAALELPLNAHGVDGEADVLGLHEPGDPDLTGLAVNQHLGALSVEHGL